MLRERPGEAAKGALVLPKARMFERIALTDWLLQPATFAIWPLVKRPACASREFVRAVRGPSWVP